MSLSAELFAKLPIPITMNDIAEFYIHRGSFLVLTSIWEGRAKETRLLADTSPWAQDLVALRDQGESITLDIIIGPIRYDKDVCLMWYMLEAMSHSFLLTEEEINGLEQDVGYWQPLAEMLNEKLDVPFVVPRDRSKLLDAYRATWGLMDESADYAEDDASLLDPVTYGSSAGDEASGPVGRLVTVELEDGTWRDIMEYDNGVSIY